VKFYLLPHSKINPVVWDDHLDDVYNGNGYAFSWYLDRVCPGWEALASEDMEVCMPLPVTVCGKKKIIRQPLLLPYVGLFTNRTGMVAHFGDVVNLLLTFYPAVSLRFSKYHLPGMSSASGTSFFSIDLMPSYTCLAERYSQEALQKIDLARKLRMVALSGLKMTDVISFLDAGATIWPVIRNKEERQRLEVLVSYALLHHKGEIAGVYDVYNHLCAMAFFVFSSHNLYVPFIAEGKYPNTTAAWYLLMDYCLKKNAEKNMVLHVDVMNLPRAREDIFTGVGALSYQPAILCYNRLPFWQRWRY